MKMNYFLSQQNCFTVTAVVFAFVKQLFLLWVPYLVIRLISLMGRIASTVWDALKPPLFLNPTTNPVDGTYAPLRLEGNLRVKKLLTLG